MPTSTMCPPGPIRNRYALPAPEEFFWQYVHSTPLAGAVARVDEDRLRSLEGDVVAHWQQFVKDGALTLEVRIVVATGRT